MNKGSLGADVAVRFEMNESAIDCPAATTAGSGWIAISL
jgi:hypothetical protein